MSNDKTGGASTSRPITEGVTNRGGINTDPSAALSRPAPPQPYGGAAFPHVSTHMDRTGMTLRDYFAGQWICGNFDCSGFRDSSAYNLAARMAYRFADAMIAERGKKVSGKPDLVGTGVQKGIVADAMIAEREKGGE